MTARHDELKADLKGVTAVPVCPFDVDDGEFDEPGFRSQMAYLRDSGVDTVVPGGNTTEFYSMNLDELRRLYEIAVEVVGGRIPVIAGVGHDVETASLLAGQAEAGGASAVMIHQPPHPFVSARGVVMYSKRVAQSVGIGVILYVRRDILGVDDYLELFEQPNIVGVKHATNDLNLLARLIAATRRSDAVWVCGSAEGWAPFYHLVGARGFTSGLANVFPTFALAMRDALATGDYGKAMEVWKRIQPFEEMRAKESSAFNVTVVKEAMNLLGRNGGAVRAPASDLGPDDRAFLVTLLEEWGQLVGAAGAQASQHREAT